MRTRRLALAALVAVALAGCDAGLLSDTTQPETTTLQPTTEATTTTAPPVPTTPPSLPQLAPSGICDSYEDAVVSGVINSPEATEISGIVASRQHPDVLWMHNDSGGGPLIYAVSTTGEDLGTFELDTFTIDWEDIAIGPGPDPNQDYLYVADIGDNLHFRPTVAVQRVEEPVPDPAGGSVADVAEIQLLYPEPGQDAEALFVDPITGDIVIITKPLSGGEAVIYRAPAGQLIDGATVELIEIGRFPLASGVWVTGADIDNTGAAVIFRGYNEVWFWNRTDLDFVETFAGEPCRTPSTAEIQGEAIAFAAAGFSYYTVSEGSNPDINYVFSIFD